MLKQLSYVFMVIGVIGSSITAARTMPDETGWENTWQISTLTFVCFILILCIGIIFSKLKDNPLLESEEKEDTPPLDQWLSDALTQIQNCLQQVELVSTSEMYQQLDTILQANLQPFDENRGWLIDQFGIGKYALVMAPFAQAERNLNRAWSASVDGYKEESIQCMERSIPSLQEAQSELAMLLQSQSKNPSLTE